MSGRVDFEDNIKKTGPFKKLFANRSFVRNNLLIF